MCTPGPHSMLDENKSFSLKETRNLREAPSVRQDDIASSHTCDRPTRKSWARLVMKNKKVSILKNACVQTLTCYHNIKHVLITQHWMGCGGMKIIHFPSRNGLLCLKNSYDNIEWGPGKIAVKHFVCTHEGGFLVIDVLRWNSN